jgi:Arc/MetJ family transcription regulator
MSLSQPEKDTALAGRIEFFVRRLFERIGGALDFALRRPLNPQPRTDLTALIPPIERAIEEKLRRAGERAFAPNLIELRYDYETYSQMSRARLEFLQRELQATMHEYIHNRRYATLGAVQVKVGFDVFTRKLTINAAFPDEAGAAEAAAEAERSARSCEVMLRLARGRSFGELRAQVASEAERAGVGRSHDNQMVIEDATVSNFHAAFTLAPNGALWLVDLGSSNGTFVNGARLGAGDKCIVRAGDRLRFGEVEAALEVRQGEG